MIGIYLEARGAVVAVARPDPLRLVAVAEVALPVELCAADPPRGAAPLALRALVRARRQLNLPRWRPVALTSEAASLIPVYAVLLAQAEMPVGWMPAVEQARQMWSSMDIQLDGALSALAGDRAVTLAAGAALIARPISSPASAVPESPAEDRDSAQVIDINEYVADRGDGGWKVQRLDGTGSAYAWRTR